MTEAETAHDHAKSFDAIHAGHFEIERDHIRAKFGDFAQSECTIHRCADDFDVGIAFQD